MSRFTKFVGHYNQKYAEACKYGEMKNIKLSWKSPRRSLSPYNEEDVESRPGRLARKITEENDIFMSIQEYCKTAGRSLFQFFFADIPQSLLLIGAYTFSKERESKKNNIPISLMLLAAEGIMLTTYKNSSNSWMKRSTPPEDEYPEYQALFEKLNKSPINRDKYEEMKVFYDDPKDGERHQKSFPIYDQTSAKRSLRW